MTRRPPISLAKCRWSVVAFVLATIVGSGAPVRADCLQGLALCAVDCDQRTRLEDPDRPQCARSCVSSYQQCERLGVLQSNTGGPIFNQGGTLAPAE